MENRTNAHRVIEEVEKAVVGKRDVLTKIMTAILAGGHVLIEDIPGTGKTTMALAFSRAMGLEVKRVQFTPDVLPADLTGFTVYRKETGRFVYQPGAVICNLLLADEINRTSPKTQSALLEVMEEHQVTVDGITHRTGDPFIVIATENPAGSAGTQLLPESQLDRFMICVSMGYPTVEEEVEILKRGAGGQKSGAERSFHGCLRSFGTSGRRLPQAEALSRLRSAQAAWTLLSSVPRPWNPCSCRSCILRERR